jgi:branched-chain amino acid transport system ATP-binding protein/nonpolar-amino-acid-transporting ATPase
MSANAALRVEQVDAGYGRIPILRQVSIEVGAEESVALIGANGAGKSTLVRAICGLLPLTAGEVWVGARRVSRLAPHDRVQQGLAVVLENRHLFGELSVRANLELARAQGERRQVERRIALADVIELFPFIEARLDAAVELLSGGEQQMVAVGRALLLQHTLLIMDEPSTGLAPKVLRHIVEAVSALRQRGIALLIVEQNVALAAQLADRGYVMSLGRVVDEIPRSQWAGIAQDPNLLRAYLGA